MNDVVVLMIVAVGGFGLGYYIAWWKRHGLGLIVERELNHRLREKDAEIARLRRQGDD